MEGTDRLFPLGIASIVLLVAAAAVYVFLLVRRPSSKDSAATRP